MFLTKTWYAFKFYRNFTIMSSFFIIRLLFIIIRTPFWKVYFFLSRQKEVIIFPKVCILPATELNNYHESMFDKFALSTLLLL